uniref:Zinc finger MYM-type protein 1 n=1 Tax=Tanacetum cinerariifolium TaxID=118510 RepID=A0A6L2MW35_TANCI|nr:zinc finger MYM-type protein 1 [Tanacetum cinerariifolium]
MKPQYILGYSSAVHEGTRMVKERLRQAFRATMLVDDTRNESSNSKAYVLNVEEVKRPDHVLNTEDPIRTIMFLGSWTGAEEIGVLVGKNHISIKFFVFVRNIILVRDMNVTYEDIIQSCNKKDNVTVKHHYHVDVFIVAIDGQLQEINNRFSESFRDFSS